MAKQPTALIILDGFANRESEHGNAVKQAHKPNFDRYYEKYPTTQIEASGLDVGLPEGQMGNSEVGHMNIGAGRIVYQSLTRINKSIEDGEFFDNTVLNNAVKHVKDNGSALHVFGLLSDGGVHSHYKHLFAILELAKKQGIDKVYVHAFLDGRDVDQKSALKYIEETEDKFKELGVGQFASFQDVIMLWTVTSVGIVRNVPIMLFVTLKVLHLLQLKQALKLIIKMM